MEFTFNARHNQPFTFEQAVLLDVPVITAEIARLQNSLTHLRDTQRQLQENVDSEVQPDLEILQALEENKHVISSQEERVSMLRLALEHKGLVSHNNPHYDHPGPVGAGQEVAEHAETSTSEDASTADGVFL